MQIYKPYRVASMQVSLIIIIITVLGIELRSLYMLGKCPTIELHLPVPSCRSNMVITVLRIHTFSRIANGKAYIWFGSKSAYSERKVFFSR
jgi:hypothetical protein